MKHLQHEGERESLKNQFFDALLHLPFISSTNPMLLLVVIPHSPSPLICIYSSLSSPVSPLVPPSLLHPPHSLTLSVLTPPFNSPSIPSHTSPPTCSRLQERSSSHASATKQPLQSSSNPRPLPQSLVPQLHHSPNPPPVPLLFPLPLRRL